MPLEVANENKLCPVCGKPLQVLIGRSLRTLFFRRYWLVCEGWPKCAYCTPIKGAPPAAATMPRSAFLIV